MRKHFFIFIHISYIKFLFGFISFFLFQNSLLGQATDRIVIKAGQNISDVYNTIYRYPEFTMGKVYFINGDSSGGRLNYNLITESIQFISPIGDTLSIDDEKTISYVLIKNDTFFYEDGYLQLLKNYNIIKLAFRERIKLADKQRVGAFGISSSTQNIESKETFFADRTHSLTIAEDLILIRESRFYLKYGSKRFVEITRNNLLKLFPKKKESIEKFLKENNTNLHDAEDLEKMVQYLQQL